MVDLGAELSLAETEIQVDGHSGVVEADSSARLKASLEEVCHKSLAATRIQRTKQKFGDMSADNTSIAVQGIVGVAQPGVDQSFGSLTATTSSRAFQGQMDAGSFGKLLEK